MSYKSNIDIDLGNIRAILDDCVLDNLSIDDIMRIIEENIYYINRDEEE